MENTKVQRYNTVIFGVSSALSTTTAAYARVSTKAQNADDKTSILSQLEVIDRFLKANEMNPIKFGYSLPEINNGAYNVKLEQFLKTHRNCTLCVIEATRFVRSKERGNMYLELALDHNITIIFIHNQLIWNPQPSSARKSCPVVRAKLLALFAYAEIDPELISMRLLQSNQYRREHFLAGTGRVPYGYKMVQEYDRELGTTIRRVVPHDYQMLIIQFIKCARTAGSVLSHFNEHLRKLVEDYNFYRSEKFQGLVFDAYQFYNADDIPVTIIAEPMTYANIAAILNYNGIMYKNIKVSKWSTELVRTMANFVPYNQRTPTRNRRGKREIHIGRELMPQSLEPGADTYELVVNTAANTDELATTSDMNEFAESFTKLNIVNNDFKYELRDASVKRARSCSSMHQLHPRKLMKYV